MGGGRMKACGHSKDPESDESRAGLSRKMLLVASTAARRRQDDRTQQHPRQRDIASLTSMHSLYCSMS